MFIDTHCHLYAREFKGDYQNILDEASVYGVNRLLIPATKSEDFKILRHMQKQFPQLWYAFGIHPFFLNCDLRAKLVLLEQELNNKTVVAIGEIGLDFYNKKELSEKDKELQLTAFDAQLDLAAQHKRPIILHARKSLSICLSFIKFHKTSGGFAHAFAGSLEEAKQLLNHGFKIGLGTTLCNPNATRVRELAKNLPADSYVLETDAPYMPLVGTTSLNHPKNIALVAQALAEIRHESVQKIAEQSTQNALSLLQ